jgi:MFS family permease
MSSSTDRDSRNVSIRSPVLVSEESGTGLRDLFRLRQARLFFFGIGLSLFGDNVLVLVAGVWVKTLTGSNGAAGLVAFFVVLPTLFLPLVGVLTDRVRKRRLMIATSAVMAAVTPTLLFVQGEGQVWLIYLVMFAHGTGIIIMSSAESGLFVAMLPERLLGTANSAFTSIQEGMKILAPAVGAALFVWWGGGIIGLLDGLTFLVACAALWALRVEEPAPQPPKRHLRAQMADGFRHIWVTTELRRPVVAGAILMLSAGLLTTALYGVVGSDLQRQPAFLGILVTMQGIGTVLGGLLAPRLIAAAGETRTTGFGAGMTTAGTAMLLAPTVPTVLASSALRGVGLGWMIIGVMTLMQRRTTMDLLGRVSSSLYMVLFVPSAISLLAGASLSELLGHRILIGAAAVFDVGAFVFLLGRRAGRPPAADRSKATTVQEA